MRQFIDVTGKTEEEAINRALEQLKLDRDDVSVEILERAKAGFLGLGSCPAKVRVSYGEDEEPAAPAQPKVKRSGRTSSRPRSPGRKRSPPKSLSAGKSRSRRSLLPRPRKHRPSSPRRIWARK